MATKSRINVTFDPETLRLADREARRRRTTRSSLIRLAIHAIAAEHEKAQAEAALRERQLKAVATMDRLARKFGDWPAQEILRASRDRWRAPRKA